MSASVSLRVPPKGLKKAGSIGENLGDPLLKKELPALKFRDSDGKGGSNHLALTPIQPGAEYIPDEVLFALTQPPAIPEKLGPPTRHRNINVGNGQSRKPPANVWNHGRKDKLKHLTEQIPCFCGAGKDISFLYDVPEKQPEPYDEGFGDKSKARDEREPPKPSQLPTTLVPDEYRVVKSKGVIGLEFYKDEFSTKVEDHEKHLVMFPSMNPTSRYEVIRLKNVMDELLKNAGVDSDINDMDGASQMHNLISLIKAEQKIYNLIFHELIRQVTVECVERGEILAKVRQRYSDLLSHVPKQIASLHEEVLAQRALDRRLTEELIRFRAQIFQLTRELTDVKEHDKLVTEQAKKAQKDLRSALEESQRNASLLGEYHELYELQRNRLEMSVHHLAEEKELWSTAAYSLAIKVIEENSLTTTKRLHISEKSWSKLAQHFTILLSDRDTEILTKLQGFKEKWRDMVETFNLSLKDMEGTITDDMESIKNGITNWVNHFKKNSLNEDGHFVKSPDNATARNIQLDLKRWITTCQSQIDKYSGSMLLEHTEAFAEIEVQIKGWTEAGLEMFARHKKDDKYPPDHTGMLELNEVHQELMYQFNNRLSGENGMARGVISLSALFEVWDTKLTNALHGGNDFPIREWMTFFGLLDGWHENVTKVQSWVGSPDTEAEKDSAFQKELLQTHDVMKKTHHWAMSTNNAIDSTDSKLVGQVSTIHTSMVKWMVNMLLRLAPDREGTSDEALTVAHQNTPSISALQEEAKGLFMIIDTYSLHVYNCCEGIVQKRVIERMSRGELNPDSERQELIQLREEAYYWIQTANLMLTQLTGEPVEYETIDTKFNANKDKAREQTFATTVSTAASEPTGPLTSASQMAASHPTVDTIPEGQQGKEGDNSKGQTEKQEGKQQADGEREKEGEETQQEVGTEAAPSGPEDDAAQGEPSAAADSGEQKTTAEGSQDGKTQAERESDPADPETAVTAADGATDAADGTETGKTTEVDQVSAGQAEKKADSEDHKKASESTNDQPAAPEHDAKPITEPDVLVDYGQDDDEEYTQRPPTGGSGLLELPRQETTGLDDDRNSAVESPAVSLPASASTPSDGMKPNKRGEFGLIEIIGPDENTQLSVLTQPTASKPPTPAVAVLNSQVATTKQSESPTIKSYEALATVDRLQGELILTEKRAQVAEEGMEQKALELNAALEKIRSLERKVEEMEASGDTADGVAATAADKPPSVPTITTDLPVPHPPVQPQQSRPSSSKARPGSGGLKKPGEKLADGKKLPESPLAASASADHVKTPSRKSVSSAGSSASRGGSRPASKTSSKRRGLGNDK